MWEPARTERSAGGVVVRRLDETWHALLIRDRYGNWGLPKGHLEDGESVREAAVREVEEETALRPDAVGSRIATIDWRFRDPEGDLIHKYCTFFLMRSRRGRPRPEGGGAVRECRWTPLGEAIERLSHDNARAVVQRAVDLLEEAGW